MRNAGLEETQAGIKIAGRNINNLRYADDTTLIEQVVYGTDISCVHLPSKHVLIKVDSNNVKMQLCLYILPGFVQLCCCCCFAALVVFNCATLWTVTCQSPLSMEFSRQEYWSELPCTPPGDLSDPEIEPRSPELQADSSLSHQGSTCSTVSSSKWIYNVFFFTLKMFRFWLNQSMISRVLSRLMVLLLWGLFK